MEQLERLKLICQDAIAKEPSDPTEREKGYTIALQHILKILESPSPTTPTDNNNTNNMKLYTESQVRIAIQQARHYEDWWNMVYEFETDDIIKDLTPIELPTDKEIRNVVFDYIEPPKQKPEESDGYNEYDMFCSFNVGAKWVIEQIKKQIK